MSIKNTLAAVCGIGIAASAIAYSGPTKAPPGTDNVAFGYGAGYNSSGANKNVIAIGTDTAMGSANNTNCIFIGNGAGAGFSGKSGAVVIGDVLVHTNGVTTVKGLNALNNNGNNTVTRGFTLNDVSGAFLGYNSQYSKWWFTGEADSAAYSDSAGVTSTVRDANNSGREIMFRLSASEDVLSIGQESYGSNKKVYATSTYLKYESGSLNVYTNGVQAGTITFTPVSQ